MSSTYRSHPPRTIGILHARLVHPHPYPRSPPVPLTQLASQGQHAHPSLVLPQPSSHLNPNRLYPRSRIGWQNRKRQELVLGIVDGHPELVPSVVHLQEPVAYPAASPYNSPETILSFTHSIIPTTSTSSQLPASTDSATLSPISSTDDNVASATPTANLVANLGAADSNETSLLPDPPRNSMEAAFHSSSTTARPPQFYVALILGSTAALACIIAALAFFIRRQGRQRRKDKIRVPWDAASSVWSGEKEPSIADEEAAWNDPKSRWVSNIRSYDEENTKATERNLAGVGLGRVVLPKPPTPIPSTTPFVDIALSPAPIVSSAPSERPPLPHSGTLLPVQLTTGDLVVANYVKGDGASLSSSSATTPSTTPHQTRPVGPVEGLPTPYGLLIPPVELMRINDAGLAVPPPAACRIKSQTDDHDMFGTPRAANHATPPSSRIIDRLRAARQAGSPMSPGYSSAWSGGWKAALSFVSPYLYSNKIEEGSTSLTPAPKRVARGRVEDIKEGFFGGELVGLSVLRSTSRCSQKLFRVGKLSRSSTRSSTKKSSVMSGLGIYGIDKDVFTLSCGSEGELQQRQSRRVKRMSRVKGPRGSKM